MVAFAGMSLEETKLLVTGCELEDHSELQSLGTGRADELIGEDGKVVPRSFSFADGK
jgi:hypothetical protein